MLKRVDEVLRERIREMERRREEEARVREEVIREAVKVVKEIMQAKGWDPESAVIECFKAEEWSEGTWKVILTLSPPGFKPVEIRPWVTINAEVDTVEKRVVVKEAQVIEAIDYATNPHYWTEEAQPKPRKEEPMEEESWVPPVPTMRDLCERLQEAREGKRLIGKEDFYAAFLTLIRTLEEVGNAIWNRA